MRILLLKIAPIFFITMGFVLSGWAPLMGKNTGPVGLSFKEQLALESKFHPSFTIRWSLQAWQRLMAKGQTENLLQFLLPWKLPSWQLTLDDFYEILSEIALSHPQPFPLGSVLRSACVLLFSIILSPEILGVLELAMCFIPFWGLLWEIWEWGKMKQMRLVLRWFAHKPIEWTELTACGVLEPIFITKKSHKKIWHQVLCLNPDLNVAAYRFSSYLKIAQMRDHQRWRQLCTLLLELCTLWVFIQMSNGLLQGFYHV